MNNWIDSCLLGIIFLSTLFGFWRGLFASVFGILTLVFAVFAALYGGGLLVPTMRNFFGASPIVPLVAGALAFLIVFLLVGLLFKMFVIFLRQADISGLNRAGGAVFGLLRGGLLVLIIVLALSAVALPHTQVWQTSQVVPVAGTLIRAFFRTATFAEYKDWVKFDKYNRPALIDGRTAPAAAQSSERLSEEEAAVTVTEALTTKRNAELQEVLDIGADYTAIKSAHSPGKDDIYRPESTTVGQIIDEILCAMTDRKNCRQKMADEKGKK